MSFNLFILGVAFNVAPARITSFILTSPDKQAVKYAKQADGGWKAVTTDQRANFTLYSTGTET